MSFGTFLNKKLAHLLGPPRYQGIFWKFIATTCFTLISLWACLIQKQGLGLSASQVAFFQMVFPFIVLLLTRKFSGGSLIQQVLTHQPLWAISRSLGSCMAFLSWFCLLRIFPLSTAVIFKLLTPLATFLAAIFFLKEKTTLTRFLGLAILLSASTFFMRHHLWATDFPSEGSLFEIVLLPVFLIAGSVGASLAGKKLLKKTSVIDATFSLLGLNTLFLAPFAYSYWQTPTLYAYGWLILIGFCEWLGQWALAKALSVVDLSILAPLSFWRFALSSFLGIAILGETFQPQLLIGTLFMLLATPLVVRKAS